MQQPLPLVDLAAQVYEVWICAVIDLGYDLGGYSVLDLMADNFPGLPLRTLKDAIVVAGIPKKAE